MLMLHPRTRATLLAAALLLPVAGLQARSTDLPRVEPNDNRAPAGRLEKGVLTVRLEARMGTWQPDGPDGHRYQVAAFAEPGGPLQTPGPIIRASSGTRVRAILRNALDKPMAVYGLGATRGIRGDSVLIAPGETREVSFVAGDAGTFFYTARTIWEKELPPRSTEDSQLHGAIVIDAPGASRRDRVFVISDWFTIDPKTKSGLGPNASLSINGRSWPHTEHLDATQGDSLRWRVINVTTLEHPMHLHGFYFRVDARGNAARDTVYAPADRRLVVTEALLPFTTMAMTWVPEKAGNWIFHCHFAGHITSVEKFEMDRTMPQRPVSSLDPHAGHGAPVATAAPLVRPASLTSGPAAESHAADMRGHNMAGLVLGIRVKPRGPQPAPAPVKRALRLEVRSKAAVYGPNVGYSYVLGGSPEANDPSAMPIPGPTLVLTKGERVAINVVNRSHEPAAVHWHGIELESFPDGVPGWSGAGRHTLPMIAPGDSFTVTFTPPRAGTFMYHSHANEMQQISSGLYGAIIVEDPAKPRVPERERLMVFSDDGPFIFFLGPLPGILLNGQKTPAPLELQAGVTYRLRLVNIRSESFIDVGLLDGETPVEWKLVAVDGADLPQSSVKTTPSQLQFTSGMIRDVEFTPKAPGKLTLRYANGRMPKELLDEHKVDVIVR